MTTGQKTSDWLGLSGRVCVVTGGGGGIGRAVALNLARAGAGVAAIDLDARGLEVTRASLRELGPDHIVIGCDTTSADSVTAASEAIEKSLGPCGVLVNAAGILRAGALETLSLADFAATLAGSSGRDGDVPVAHGNIEFESYFASDGRRSFNWIIHPEGFDGASLLELARLQGWTLKPARFAAHK